MCSNIQIMALLIAFSRSVSLFSSSFFIAYHLCYGYTCSALFAAQPPRPASLCINLREHVTHTQAVCHFLVTDTISHKVSASTLCMDLCLFAYDYDGRISCHRKQKTRSKRTLLDMFAEDGAIPYGYG